MDKDVSSLDDLFSVAKQHIIAQRQVAAKKAAEPKRLILDERKEQIALYADPKNWERKRGVALVHSDTQTLLGNFSEYTHRSVARCRKLVREDSLLAVEATEFVSGSWWLEEAEHPEPGRAWSGEHPIVIDLHLPVLSAHAPLCEVIARLEYGSLRRVDLAVDTMFVGGEGKQLLFLVAGTNVLECLSHECRMAVREEIDK